MVNCNEIVESACQRAHTGKFSATAEVMKLAYHADFLSVHKHA